MSLTRPCATNWINHAEIEEGKREGLRSTEEREDLRRLCARRTISSSRSARS
jgi:hypothetical protein